MHTFADRHALIPEINQDPSGRSYVRTLTVDHCASKAGKPVSNPADGTSESDSSIWGCLITGRDFSSSLSSERIPENNSNNTWSPPCGRGGLHSHVKKKKEKKEISELNQSAFNTQLFYTSLSHYSNFSSQPNITFTLSASRVLTKVTVYCKKINIPIQ